MTRLTLTILIGVVLLGVALRLLGMLDLQLWCDEAMWAVRLMNGEWGWMRPVGYMWLTHQLVLLENNEPMLRALSTTAGIAQLPLVYFVLRRILSTATFAIAGTYMVAISPIAVAMSKEFKPYMLEGCLHAFLVALALAYSFTRQPRWLAATLATAMAAPLFAWSVLFAYPAVFLVLAWDDWRERRLRRVIPIVLAAAAILVMLTGALLARVKTSAAVSDKWGDKYDVFYSGRDGLASRVVWFVDKTFDIAAFPARLLWPWPLHDAALAALAVASIVLCALGIAWLAVRKQWVPLALLVSPWLVTAAFNIARMWPYGVFRTNVFLHFYVAVLVAIGADAVVLFAARWPRSARRSLAAAGVALALALFPFDVEPFRHKPPSTLTGEAWVRTAMERLKEIETGAGKGVDERRLLVADGHACRLYNYYKNVHAQARAELHDWFVAHFEHTCAKGEARRAYEQKLDEVRGRSFWLLTAKPQFAKLTRARLTKECSMLREEVFPASTRLFRCEAK